MKKIYWALIFPLMVAVVALAVDADAGFVGSRRVLLAAGNAGQYVSQFYNAATSSLFFGPNAGNQSSTGTDNTALGVNAGLALTVPASGANPQADTFVGYNAGAAVTTSRESTLIGYEAGENLTGNGTGIEDGINTAIGSQSLQTCTSACGDVVAVGQKAAEGLTAGSGCLFIGDHAGVGLTSTCGNDVYIGNFVLGSATSVGTQNTVIGGGAAPYLGSGAANNVIVGYNAGAGTSVANNTTTDSVLIGASVADGITSGAGEVIIGYQAGAATGANGSNVYVGYQAGNSNTSIGNVFVGYQAGLTITGAARDVCIGIDACASLPNNTQNAFVSGDSGNQKITDVYFGSGYAAAAPINYTIHGSGASGANIVGGNIVVGGGRGTGTGAGGTVSLATAPASGSSGSTLNALVNGLTLGTNQVIQFNSPNSFTATISNCGGAIVTTASGCLIIVDNNGNTVYLPVFGAL